MAFDAGEIKGRLTLDRSGYTSSLKSGVEEAVSESEKMEKALVKPFEPARDAAGRFSGSLSDASKRADELTRATGSLDGKLSSLQQVMTTAAGTALGNMFSSAVGEIHRFDESIESTIEHGVQLAGQFESIGLSMRIMIGDADEAKQLMGDLRTFANTTPFQFQELADAGKQLLAMGIDAKDVVSTLRMLGDVSSGLSQPIGEVAYLFGQVKSRGTASAIELKEFAMRGVPIYSELAKVLHITEQQVREFTKEGEVGFNQINAAFRSMTAEGGKFAGMTQEQSKSILGLESTLADAWTNMQEQMGEAIVKGTDGKNLITKITDEVTSLTPTVVDLGVSLATAFTGALPYIKSALEYMQALGVAFGLVDLTKLYPDVYNNDRSKGLSAAPNTAESFDKLGQVQGNISAVAGSVANDAKGLKTGSFDQPKIVGKAEELRGNSEIADRMIADARAAVAKGEKLSDEQFNRLRTRIAGNVQLIGKLQEAISVGAGSGNFSDVELGKLSGLQERLRSVQAASATALTEFEKIAQRQDETAKKAKADKDKAAQSAGATPAPAAAQETGHSAGREGRTFDLAQALTDAQVATLEAAGKKEQADLSRAKERFDRDIERIMQAHQQGSLDDASLGVATASAGAQYQAEQNRIRAQAAKEREADQNSESRTLADVARRTEEFQSQAQEAGLRERGDKFGAEMVAFDASWKRRIDVIRNAEERSSAITAYEAERREKIREHEAQAAEGQLGRAMKRMNRFDPSVAPTSIKDAQDRVSHAKAGSGERELARLDLRDMVWNRDHPNGAGNPYAGDDARHRALADRFGRHPSFAIAGPSAFSAIAPMLAPRQQQSRSNGSSEHGSSPVINSAINVDIPAVSKAVYDASKKGMFEALTAIMNKQRDRNYSNRVGENL